MELNPSPSICGKMYHNPMRALAPVLYLRKGTFVIVLLRQEKAVEIVGIILEGRCGWQQEKSRLLTKEERFGAARELLPKLGEAKDRRRAAWRFLDFIPSPDKGIASVSLLWRSCQNSV